MYTTTSHVENGADTHDMYSSVHAINAASDDPSRLLMRMLTVSKHSTALVAVFACKTACFHRDCVDFFSGWST